MSALHGTPSGELLLPKDPVGPVPTLVTNLSIFPPSNAFCSSL